MDNLELFTRALTLPNPWKVQSIDFQSNETTGQEELHIRIGHSPGAKFATHGEQDCPVYDHREKTWQHLHFFQYRCFIHCNTPRVVLSDGKPHLVEVPWARSGSGFTLLFEAFGMQLVEKEMPVSQAAEQMGINDKRFWRFFKYWVDDARAKADYSDVEAVGIDETSTRRGHHYFTLGVDLKQNRVVHVSENKDADAVKSFAQFLESVGCKPEQIRQASIDFSRAFIKGVHDCFPSAQITFDRFHLAKMINEALDATRREYRSKYEQVKHSRWALLKNPINLTANQKKKLEEVKELEEIGEAYRLKTLFADFYTLNNVEEAEGFLVDYCLQLRSSGLRPFQELAKTINRHWDGILNYVRTRITNGILESINSQVQLAKRRARGYRNLENFKTMIYFIAGKLDFSTHLI